MTLSPRVGADADAIEAVYRSRHSGFRNALATVTGGQESARDAVQEGFAIALAKRSQFRGGSLEAWVWRIALRGAMIESVPLPPPPGAPSQPGPLGNPDPARDCPVGESPTSPSPRIDEPVRPLTDKLVLGCTTIPNGQRIELVGYRIGTPGDRGAFCIDLVRVPEGLASGCGTTRGADGIAVHSFSFGVGLPRRLTGAATPRARTIRFHYRHRGKASWQHTNAIRLDSPSLVRLGVRRRFVYWIADLPDGAQPLRVEARAGGKVLASAPGRPGR